MKKLVLITLTATVLGLLSCNSEKKDGEYVDSVVDTSMGASPGLDTNAVGTDTTTKDTTLRKTNNPEK
jgi:uncharacterized lipoprotein NlpE involved in copper resistance